jgi:hypothetical protein
MSPYPTMSDVVATAARSAYCSLMWRRSDHHQDEDDALRLYRDALKHADPNTSGWVPDPADSHALRFVKNGMWTEAVLKEGDLSSDSSLTGAAAFDWDMPAPADGVTGRDWLASGTYVYRCQCKSGGKPISYSPVWSGGAKFYSVEATPRRATHIQSGAALSWRTGLGGGLKVSWSDGTKVGTIGMRSLQDANRQKVALRQPRKNPYAVLSLTGDPVAFSYSARNPKARRGRFDDTYVLTVTESITGPLSPLLLVWGLRLSYLAHPNTSSQGVYV